MGLATGDAGNVWWTMQWEEQTYMTVFRWVCTVSDPATSVQQDLAAIAGLFNDSITATLPLAKAILCQNDNLEYVSTRAQRTYPSRTTFWNEINTAAGANASVEPTTGNICGVIIKRTTFPATRSVGRGIGSVHLPGINSDAYEFGSLTPAFKTKLDAFGSTLLGSFIPAGTIMRFKMCTGKGANAFDTPVFSTEAQTQVRTMRRRTLGRGI